MIFDYSYTETVKELDDDKALSWLRENCSKHWNAITFFDFKWKGYVFVNIPMPLFPRKQAPYYKQFFDLRGEVFLTLEQYGKLKEYIQN